VKTWVSAICFWIVVYLVSGCAHKIETKDRASASANATIAVKADEKAQAATVATVDKRPKRVIHLRPDSTPWKVEEDAGEFSKVVSNSSSSSSSSTAGQVSTKAETERHEIKSPRLVMAGVVAMAALLAGCLGLLVAHKLAPAVRRWVS
jgi:hypothetical protein